MSCFFHSIINSDIELAFLFYFMPRLLVWSFFFKVFLLLNTQVASTLLITTCQLEHQLCPFFPLFTHMWYRFPHAAYPIFLDSLFPSAQHNCHHMTHLAIQNWLPENVHIKSLDKAASFLAYRWSLLCHVHHHCHRWWVLRMPKCACGELGSCLLSFCFTLFLPASFF